MFRDFKDDEEHQDELFKKSKEQFSDSPSTNRKKTTQPSRLVNLGAAASYTGDQQQRQQQQQQQQQTDAMTDLFGNISVDPKPTQQQPSQFSGSGFADFESAFSSGLQLV